MQSGDNRGSCLSVLKNNKHRVMEGGQLENGEVKNTGAKGLRSQCTDITYMKISSV